MTNANDGIKVLGIIGIRSGSKGVPDKNIRPLAGKPLVGWILETALRSKQINRLVISTDSEKYAEIARKYGAEVPYLRPSDLAQDNSSEIDYVHHMIKWLAKNENYFPDIIVRMMATVPLQQAEDIDAVVEILKNDPYSDSAVVIAEARQHPLKALKIAQGSDGKMKLVTYFSDSGREVTPIARQSYTPAYFRANVIACRTSVIYDTNSLTGDTVRYHIIPQERAVDIDSMMDFSVVEHIMNQSN